MLRKTLPITHWPSYLFLNFYKIIRKDTVNLETICPDIKS